MDCRMPKSLLKTYLLILLSILSPQVICSPWLSSGEPWTYAATSATKSDVDLLASYGLIQAPVLTWPIPWDSIAESLLSDESKIRIKTAPSAVQLAYFRMVSQYEAATQRQLKGEAFVSGGSHINPFRSFDYQPRSNINSGFEIEKQGDNWAGEIALSYGKYKDLTQQMHLDDSYAYGFFHLGPLGKWGLGVDKMPRWWSPSYVDSLILSNNAPPLPTITLQRMQAEAFQTKWLSWIGPWSFITSLSQGDPNEPVPRPLIWLTNLSIRPLDSLQFSFSRVAFFAGETRPLTPAMLKNLVIFRDNIGYYGVTRDNEPGTEHAEISLQWSPRQLFPVPTNIYLQTIFNDSYSDTIPHPFRTNFILGANSLFNIRSSTLRLYVESEYMVQKEYWLWQWTHKDLPEQIYNMYGYSTYPYYYHGKIIGSPLGGETKAINVGGIISEPNGNSDTIRIRYLRLNTYHFNGLGYPFKKQNVLWASFSRSILLSPTLGKLSGQIAYLQSLKGKGLSSSPSFYLTWSRVL